MPDLTLKRMDATIDREIDRIVRSTDANFGIEYGEDMNRAIFLAGMRTAATITEEQNDDLAERLRATVRRLRKEARNVAD